MLPTCFGDYMNLPFQGFYSCCWVSWMSISQYWVLDQNTVNAHEIVQPHKQPSQFNSHHNPQITHVNKESPETEVWKIMAAAPLFGFKTEYDNLYPLSDCPPQIYCGREAALYQIMYLVRDLQLPGLGGWRATGNPLPLRLDTAGANHQVRWTQCPPGPADRSGERENGGLPM